MAVAIAMGIVNAIATAGSFIYDQYQFGLLKARILELELGQMEVSRQQSIFGNNAEFLFHENKFLGINNKIVVDHLNVLNELHACDVLVLALDNCIERINDRLSLILDAIDSTHLTRHLLDHNTLSELTLNTFFHGTIYAYSPYELYSRGRVHLRSFGESEIVFVISVHTFFAELD